MCWSIQQCFSLVFSGKLGIRQLHLIERKLDQGLEKELKLQSFI